MFKEIFEWEIATPNGWAEFRGIQKIDSRQLLNITFSDASVTSATEDHTFFIAGQPIEVKDLKPGMILDSIEDSKVIRSVELSSIDSVYDIIESSDNHKFIVNKGLITKNCDEFAFIDHNLMEKFWPSNYPTIASNKGQIIIVSTPNGASGKFYELYNEALNYEINKTPFRAVTFPWTRHPEKDEQWKQDMLATMTEVQFKQEFECSFAGSTYTLINGDTLSDLKRRNPIEVRDDGKYQLWEKPIRGHVYAFGIDSAAGNGNDFSVVLIFDITQFIAKGKYHQVAQYRCNDTSIFDFANIVYKMAYEWNEAVIILENNESGLGNILGMQLYNEKAYERIFFDFKLSRVGVNSNVQTKKLGTTYFKQDLESKNLEICSGTLIDELLIYEEKENQPGVFSAKRGRNYHDDTVVGSFWVSYFLRTEWFDSMKEEIYTKAHQQITDSKGKTVSAEQLKLIENRESERYDSELADAFMRKSKSRKGIIDAFQSDLWAD